MVLTSIAAVAVLRGNSTAPQRVESHVEKLTGGDQKRTPAPRDVIAHQPSRESVGLAADASSIFVNAPTTLCSGVRAGVIKTSIDVESERKKRAVNLSC